MADFNKKKLSVPEDHVTSTPTLTKLTIYLKPQVYILVIVNCVLVEEGADRAKSIITLGYGPWLSHVLGHPLYGIN